MEGFTTYNLFIPNLIDSSDLNHPYIMIKNSCAQWCLYTLNGSVGFNLFIFFKIYNIYRLWFILVCECCVFGMKQNLYLQILSNNLCCECLLCFFILSCLITSASLPNVGFGAVIVCEFVKLCSVCLGLWLYKTFLLK